MQVNFAVRMEAEELEIKLMGTNPEIGLDWISFAQVAMPSTSPNTQKICSIKIINHFEKD